MTYTFETYEPSRLRFGARIKGIHTVLHRAPYADLADAIRPSMIRYVEFEADDDAEAIMQARLASKVMGYKFHGIAE